MSAYAKKNYTVCLYFFRFNGERVFAKRSYDVRKPRRLDKTAVRFVRFIRYGKGRHIAAVGQKRRCGIDVRKASRID